LQAIQNLNQDRDVHGIIVQRPLPDTIDKQGLAESTMPEKDIDGFHSQSLYGIPVALAVVKILERMYGKKHPTKNDFTTWLHAQRIVCLGKGDTAGKPIIEHLQKQGMHPDIVDSQTPDPQEVTRHADIIISSVGKPGVINESNIKPGAILIGVGITKDGNESLLGDFDVDAIKDIAGYYTPTPGGVGPVNVAFLLNNLILAAKKENG
jgi:methylenetetrahydrofolate dehydrogenase (NADP+) / methenyltetrahydrofolate cyclohydrolase